MKIVTVVGARPQIVKAAAVSNVLRQSHNEILVHTGQHYDTNMSDIFFEELGIPLPNVNLGIGSGGHGEQTGQMLAELEKLYQREKPSAVLVYGDTNSTLAGALAASKMQIPVAHVEAGLRSFNKAMPEEQNRILTDHISQWLFVPTETAENNLRKEGIEQGIQQVGDVMYDGVMLFQKKILPNVLEKFGLHDEYLLCTIHRAENTNDKQRLASILNALARSGQNIVLPLHPRTEKLIHVYGLSLGKNIKVIAPVGYLDMLALMQNAKKIVTDSGGVQKEAYFLAKPCITMREETEWVETVEQGWNLLTGAEEEKILNALSSFVPKGKPKEIFGDGTAALKISNFLSKEIF